jgi:hypothetical protein
MIYMLLQQRLFDVGQRGVIVFLFMLVTNKGEHSNLLKVNKYWHDRKGWEKE